MDQKLNYGTVPLRNEPNKYRNKNKSIYAFHIPTFTQMYLL